MIKYADCQKLIIIILNIGVVKIKSFRTFYNIYNLRLDLIVIDSHAHLNKPFNFSLLYTSIKVQEKDFATRAIKVIIKVATFGFICVIKCDHNKYLANSGCLRR